MKAFEYSIIIPHKNTPSLLARCVASIPKREDVQIIVVDDNSDPNIVDFDNFPIINDDHTIVIFDKSGGGAGRARNIGMAKASGEKFIFADADDFFNYCINEVLEEYKNDKTDIVFFNASSCDSTTYVNYPNRTEFRNNLFEGYKKDPKLYEYYLRYECGSPWSKIIRKDLIITHNVTFQESIVNNDTKFSYTTGHLAKSVKIDQRAIYCVTFLSSSISFTMNDEKYMTTMNIIAEQEIFCRKNRQGLHPQKSYPISYLCNHLVTLHESKKKVLYDECLKIIDKYGIGKEVRNVVRKRLFKIKVGGFVLKLVNKI